MSISRFQKAAWRQMLAPKRLASIPYTRLKRTTIVSIGHRSTLAAFHRRGLVLERDGELNRLREAALAPAAE